MFREAYRVCSFGVLLFRLCCGCLYRRHEVHQQAQLSRKILSRLQLLTITCCVAHLLHACREKVFWVKPRNHNWIESSPQTASKTDILLSLHTLPCFAIWTRFTCTSVKPGPTLLLCRVHSTSAVPCESINLGWTRFAPLSQVHVKDAYLFQVS